ncbi:MAG: hypothetical protein JWN65_1996, partial [Solirubrobacterales bacterium]|nr:hypothetical protein [Solirubrobacterales bacterium]
AAERAADAGDGRPRPERDASQTVVDRRDPSVVDETLIADVPEFPHDSSPPTSPTRAAEPPAAPPTGPTRVVGRDDQLRLDDERRTDPDGQLRFDGG